MSKRKATIHYDRALSKPSYVTRQLAFRVGCHISANLESIRLSVSRLVWQRRITEMQVRGGVVWGLGNDSVWYPEFTCLSLGKSMREARGHIHMRIRL